MKQKCKVILLPTDYRSKIFKHEIDGDIHLFNEPRTGTGDAFPQHLYILSDDEIKEGDWCISTHPYTENPLIKVLPNMAVLHLQKGGYTGWFKIIATTNPDLIKEDIASIDDEFIREYCSNPVDDVLVEYEENNPTMYSDGIDSRGDYIYYCPKCKYGGSYMGIINEKDIPRCYKKECSDIQLKITNGYISIKPVEETWDELDNKFQLWCNENHRISFITWLKNQNYEVPKQKLK